jgi:hypothetical protein
MRAEWEEERRAESHTIMAGRQVLA